MAEGGVTRLRKVSGRFYRAVPAHRVASTLSPPGPESAGRYHRHGQRALYLTPEADWAIIAVGGYMAEDGVERLVVPVEVSESWVFDQHDEAACIELGIDRDTSNLPWHSILAAGAEPPSWRNADAARRAGADGIIDRSRGIVGGWHVALFRWNALGAPTVSVAGEPLAIDYASARARWTIPPGWVSPVRGGRVG